MHILQTCMPGDMRATQTEPNGFLSFPMLYLEKTAQQNLATRRKMVGERERGFIWSPRSIGKAKTGPKFK